MKSDLSPIDDVTIVIRAAGERTEASCRAILEAQVAAENVIVIHEKPFRKAVEKNFILGIERNKKWTLAVDADVLLCHDAVVRMINNAARLDDNLYVYHGYVLDKLFATYRHGGPHLYRTDKLPQALEHIKRYDAKVIRPESDVYRAMAKSGYLVTVDKLILGIHDYEQYYSDLFRKSFFHAIKHDSTAFLRRTLPLWVDQIKHDQDYRVALYGLSYGFMSHDEQVDVDIDYFNKVTQQAFQNIPLEEKKILPGLSQSHVESLLTSFDKKFPNAKKNIRIITLSQEQASTLKQAKILTRLKQKIRAILNRF